MLSHIFISNFKSFASPQQVPLKPITLVFGPNSAGKSSLIHSLLLTRHAARTGELDAHQLESTADSVNLGGFDQYRNHSTRSYLVDLGLEVDASDIFGSTVEGKKFIIKVGIGSNRMIGEMSIASNDRRTGGQYGGEQRDREDLREWPVVMDFEICIDDEVILKGSRQFDVIQSQKAQDYQNFRLTKINLDHSAFRHTACGLLSTPAANYLTPNHLSLLERIFITPGDLFPAGASLDKGTLDDADLMSATNNINMFLAHVSKGLSGMLGGLRYVGPIRKFPKREMSFGNNINHDLLSEEDYVWYNLAQNDDVRKRLNEWLGSSQLLDTPYQIDVEMSLSFDYMKHELPNALIENIDLIREFVEATDDDRETGAEQIIGKLVRYLESTYLPVYKKLLLRDQRIDDPRIGRVHHSLSLQDVGSGIGQILPVLAEAFACERRLIAIEQPELHIHPKLQAELGDIFIRSALGKQQNQFILETHSEHLILRLMRRMRQTVNGDLPEGIPPVTPADVAILYVQPVEQGSVVRELELDEEGQLLDQWPGGFFEEGFNERFC